jgi:addiction module RelE/StbE family toxin
VYTIITTDYFLRRARKFLRKHPDLRERFAQVVDDLKANPFAPHLACHPLSGKLKDVQAVSITYDYRMILTIEIAEHEIILLDIESHDEVYR